MEYKMAGRIVLIKPTETIQTRSGGSYTKREIVLDCTRFDSITGERGFDNFPYFTFSGEKCKLLDGFQVGQIVNISFDIQGYKGSRGDDAYFNTVRGYKIEAIQPQYQQPQAQTVAQPSAQPSATYAQPTGYQPSAGPTQPGAFQSGQSSQNYENPPF